MMLGQIEEVVKYSEPGDPPAYTLILGAGASSGAVPTAKQMLGIPDLKIYHSDCIPAYLHELEHGAVPTGGELERCVHDFWRRFTEKNAGKSTIRLDANGLPSAETISECYTALFAHDRIGGLNNPGRARAYLRRVTMGEEGKIRLNGTHFFLGSLLSLQNRRPEETGSMNRPLYIGKRPFARTLFTTNFDPLLQVSLQLFHNLYYMTDRPDHLAADALHTDDHAALHLVYAHGSVHRPFLANTSQDIAHLRQLNGRALAPYLGRHGVIVLGYSGWDDCLLHALDQTTSFEHNLYWLARGECALSLRIRDFLFSHPNAFWVNISDGGEFMATLHSRLCPGMAMTELLRNPIRPLCERLGRVDLTGIPGSDSASVGVEKQTTPEEFRQQVLALLAEAGSRFTDPGSATDPALDLKKLEHQADLAYSIGDPLASIDLYSKIAEHREVPRELKAKALFRRGAGKGWNGNEAGAIGDYSAVIDLWRAPAEWVSKALFNRAFHHSKASRTEEAIADYSRVIDLPGAPADQVAMALVNRGVCHSSAGRIREEIADYSRVIDLPGAPATQVVRALRNRGVCHSSEGRIDEAVADHSRAIGLPGAPADEISMALVNRGFCHSQAGRTDAALADFSRAIDLPGAPADQVAMALVNRGVCHSQTGRTDLAIADYARAIDLPGALSAQVAMALVNRGVCQSQAGETEAALADFSRTIDLLGAPTDQVAVALRNRGICYAQAGRTEKAIADYSRVIDLPGSPSDQVAKARMLLGPLQSNQVDSDGDVRKEA